MGFKRFSSHDRLIGLMKALVYSLAFGIIVGAVIFILVKRLVLPFDAIFSLPIGLGAGVIAFVPLFFILRPSDKKVAKRLDDEFSLDERVTTMLELREVGGPMAELQREDTEARLAEIPTRNYRTKRVWAMIVAAALSVVIAVTSFIVPVVAAPEPPEEIIDEFDKDWRIASLRDLIKRVQADNYAEAPLKDELILVLEGLIEVVRSTDKGAVMRQSAIRGIGTVDAARARYVSSTVFASIFSKTEHEGLMSLSKPLTDFDDVDFGDALSDIVDGLTVPYDESIVAFIDIFNTVLTEAAVSPDDDTLSALFDGFSTKLRLIADSTADIGEVRDAADALSFALFDVLLQQQDNNKIALIVRSGIISIFELTAEDFAGTNVTPPSEGELEPPPDDNIEEDIKPGAGYGKGDQLAGSNDSFYDHDEREQVVLPDVVNKYYNRFDEIMDDLDGDLRSAIEEYFEILKKPESLL